MVGCNSRCCITVYIVACNIVSITSVKWQQSRAHCLEFRCFENVLRLASSTRSQFRIVVAYVADLWLYVATMVKDLSLDGSLILSFTCECCCSKETWRLACLHNLLVLHDSLQACNVLIHVV